MGGNNSFEQLVETYYQVILVEVSHLRWRVTGGLDNISAPQIKRAPPNFLKALAFFAARCAWLQCFPRFCRLARAKFIPKPEEGKYRGLRLESLLTKLVEKCVLHPFFPSFGPDPGLIAPEHLADRKQVSAEMTAAILGILIDAHRDRPLHILIADVKEAYDNVWRDALWAKLAAAHDNSTEVNRARALYLHMDAQIVENGFASETVELKKGIPQGGPRSGKLFAFYNSDLPAALREAGAGTLIGDVEFTCATYLDDTMTPSSTECAARRVITTLEQYEDRWSQKWSAPKFKMLCLNVRNPPTQWPFKDSWFDTVATTKYLGVHFDPRGGWKGHFVNKRVAALVTREALRRAGLFGGRNAPADGLEVVRAMLWPTLDYGRGVASSEGRGCQGVANLLDAFQLDTLRGILGVSKVSVKAGVRGELGEVQDVWRERKRKLLLARQMLNSPEGSMMARIAHQANSASPKWGIFRHVESFLTGVNSGRRRLEDFRSRRDIKAWIHSAASTEWAERVSSNRRLARTYPLAQTLSTKGYLKQTYPGRQVLTRIRIDDLTLGAAGCRAAAADTETMCTLCGEEPETREHFTLRCRRLTPAREANRQAIDLTLGVGPELAFEVIILARPAQAADDVERAKTVGRLLHDLWNLRTQILGLRPSLD
jgi:hypothetical protein